MRTIYLALPLLIGAISVQSRAVPARLQLPAEALSSDMRISGPAIAGLARSVIPRLPPGERQAHLDALFRLQDLAGRPGAAVGTLRAFGVLNRRDASPRNRVYNAEFLVYERARALQPAVKGFEAAYRRAFRKTFAPLDDRDAASALNRFPVTDMPAAARALSEIRNGLKGKSRIGVEQAVSLLRAYYLLKVATASDAGSRQLAAEEDAKRWTIDRDVRVRVPGGATVCALIIRPRSAPARAPAALQFTIYADPSVIIRDARRAAGYGYNSIIGMTRGKACSPDAVEPYEHDGEDADALIEWIARQQWSDGQVGLYGGSYSGFTAWAALKHPPSALKTIYIGSPASPGIDVPMEGNVAWMFPYPWPFYTTDNKYLDNETYGDFERWDRLQKTWYASGRAFDDLQQIDGKPNPIWAKWMAHPAYDQYWKAMQASDAELMASNVPVLQTAGYYFGGPGAAVPYFERLERLNPAARSYLLVGPYDHFQAQVGFPGALVGESDSNAGLSMDAAAHIDLTDLRFAWFDHFMKGAPMPPLIADRINYQVTGANRWKHAPTLDAMGTARKRYFLMPDRTKAGHVLSATLPPNSAASELRVDLADRSDAAAAVLPDLIKGRHISTAHGLSFESAPLARPTEASGLFCGHLEFITNKKDFDLEIDLYERTSAGEFILLAPWWIRASYAASLSERRLLTPGVPQAIDFRSVRLMSRRMASGSRLIAVVRVIKGPDRQINYGTGKRVGMETVADAAEPLAIAFSSRSWIEVPTSAD